ncbi:beta-galactosidase GalB [uncultured Draconibacterium sp.]|uniref:beta-galactosidase GalB n=1 Tax=uncultured Draconibacterium sp. TaxID=1573823 RepID=UPI0025FD5693|nr:beta-galactosidase GalB [uncultured Draconibacterium sp.]
MTTTSYKAQISRLGAIYLIVLAGLAQFSCSSEKKTQIVRQKLSINEGWKFYKYENVGEADELIYDVRPDLKNNQELRVADAKPTEAVDVSASQEVLKPWILPTANGFINNPKNHYVRPEGKPGANFPFVQGGFDDSAWESINLPHDWAIAGPFQKGWDSEVGGGMGRLPSNGVAWYRRKLNMATEDLDKAIYLQIDGAMSYSMVWLNGHLVGGWPYGYNSYQLDLTPYLKPGADNQLAIRLDNPNHSARWYPGGGLYRNVWLIKTNKVHVAQWGTFITTPKVSEEAATVRLKTTVKNDCKEGETVEIETAVYALSAQGVRSSTPNKVFEKQEISIAAGQKAEVISEVQLDNPKLWGPFPTQTPNLYVAITQLYKNGKLIDEYETRFGIRSLEFDPNRGVLVNGELIKIQGVNNHHDLGALGAAFNKRAAERQLEILKEMGCNAVRMAHNPPAPELLELTDSMGFLVMDEIFDSWERKKTAHDFHLIFPEWSEADARSFIRRDRNHPSIIMWSFGNEVGEQYTGAEGAAVGQRLYDIVKEEDTTRPTVVAMNFAKHDMELPKVPDVIGLNYQGEGIRWEPQFEGTDRIRTAPSYDAFHKQFPDKVILSTETASVFSSRGFYTFPVTPEISSPTRDGQGGNSELSHVSSYELYCVDFGSSPDRVFKALDTHPFVAGEFVWTGFDYLGEPTPYYNARSCYNGIIDLAGFKKDRFFLYQARWRPDFPMAHILPHWNWPRREGKITPVHVFTSGDEAELFLNGKSLGKKKKGEYEYRLRWDDVLYQPGTLKVVTYKNGKVWAEEEIRTTGEARKLTASADREIITANGNDLAFVTVKVCDEEGLMVPKSMNRIDFEISGPAEIVATDNGDQTCMTSFTSLQRKAFNGMALAIVRTQKGQPGKIILTAKSEGLETAQLEIVSK